MVKRKVTEDKYGTQMMCKVKNNRCGVCEVSKEVVHVCAIAQKVVELG